MAIIFFGGGDFYYWFPPGGLQSVDHSPEWPWWQRLVDQLWHLCLPVLVLSYGGFAGLSRFMRSSMLENLRQDFVLVARSKGLAERVVIYKHVLRNSMIPIITLWGLDFGAVIGGGAILTETVFDLQGVGQYAAEAIGQLDVPPVLATTLFAAFFIVLLNAIVDIMYAFLDPRIRLT